MELMPGNPWSGLFRQGPRDAEEEDCHACGDAAGGPAQGAGCREWHGLAVTQPPLEWSGTVSGHPKAMALTRGQYDCLMSLRYRFPVAVVPPSHASDGPVGGVFGYTHRTVHALLKHGLIKQGRSGAYTITDNGLHAVRMYRPKG